MVKQCLKSLALVLGMTVVHLLPLCADDRLEGFDRIIFGREDEGFNYYLVTQLKKKRKDDAQTVEVPVLAINGSAIYEGISIRNPKIKIITTLTDLEKHGRLPESVRPESSSPWIKNSLSVKIDSATVEKFLEHLGRSRAGFEKNLSNMSRDKARLFYALLFEKNLKLSTENIEAEKRSVHPEIESEPTLESLSLSSQNPDPDPVRVPIPISTVWDWFFDFIMDVYVDTIDIHFAEKRILFDPTSNLIKVKMRGTSADLTGKSRNIGRVKNASRFFDRLQFYDTVSKLNKASIGAFQIEFAFRLQKNPNGFWQLDLADPKKPLELVMLDTAVKKPTVKLSVEGRPDEERDLPDRVIKKIEDVLAKTLMTGLTSSFFPDEFGFRIPIELPYYERLNDEDRKSPDTPNVTLEISMGQFRIIPDGLLIAFDSRINRFKRPTCLRDFSEGSDISEKLAPLQDYGKGAWEVTSHVDVENNPQKKNDVSSLKWQRSANISTAIGTVNVSATHEGLSQLSRAAALGGLYCVSTRALWPRPGYSPLLEFRPRSSPQIKLAENAMLANVSGELFSYARKDSMGRDAFEVTSKKDIDVAVDFYFDPDTLIRWKPREILLSNSVIENDFVQNIANLVFPRAPDKKQQGIGSELLISKLTKERFRFEELKITPADVSGVIKIQDFKFLDEDDAKPSQPVVQELAVPKTERVSGVPTEIHTPNIEIRWKPSDELFFSWRQKTTDDKKWSEWSPFEKTDHKSLQLEKTGRYYVQVKAMNRSFQVEEVPVQYEFYYQAQSDQNNLMTPPKAGEPSESAPGPKNESSAQNQNANPPPPAVLPSKGLFGCELDATGTSNSLALWLCLLSAVVAVGILRLRLHNS
jgi:hypothetical protein